MRLEVGGTIVDDNAGLAEGGFDLVEEFSDGVWLGGVEGEVRVFGSKLVGSRGNGNGVACVCECFGCGLADVRAGADDQGCWHTARSGDGSVVRGGRMVHWRLVVFLLASASFIKGDVLRFIE